MTSPANSKGLQFATTLVLFLAGSSRAEIWQSQQLNFAINLPLESGWTQVTPPADVVKVSIRSADRTKVISVSVSAIGHGLSEESFVERFKNRWFEHGTGKGKSEERIQLGGHTGYRLKDIANLGGKDVHRADTVVIDNGRLYQIDAMGIRSDPFNDPAVVDCTASFRFLGQVASPPSKPSSSAPADKLPERIADITFVVLIGIVVVFVVVKIRKKRGQ